MGEEEDVNGAAATALKNLIAAPSKQPGTAGECRRYDCHRDFPQCITHLEALLLYWLNRFLNGSTESIPCRIGMGFREFCLWYSNLDFPLTRSQKLKELFEALQEGQRDWGS